MKRVSALLLCMGMLLLFTACTKTEITLTGEWESSTGSYVIQVNADDGVLYLTEDTVLFRGYFIRNGEHYELYNDGDILMMSYIYDDKANVLLEYNIDGAFVDQYTKHKEK